MDDPTPRSKKGRETECVLGGSCSQARAPIFFIPSLGTRFLRMAYRISKARTRLDLRYRSHWFHAPQYWNVRLPEHMLDFRFF
jgi:hypothetical protein